MNSDLDRIKGVQDGQGFIHVLEDIMASRE
jgi:hypothetical protein